MKSNIPKKEKVEQANHNATALIWLLPVTCMSKWHLCHGMITKIYKLQKDVIYVKLSLTVFLIESTKAHKLKSKRTKVYYNSQF